MMFNNWKHRLTGNWNVMRVIRMVLGVLVLVEAWKSAEIMFGILGLVLLVQALLNIGCSNPGGCAVSPVTDKAKQLRDASEKVHTKLN